MKKSSRDYRKNNRKKWVRINHMKAMVAISTMTSMFNMAMIKSTQGYSKEEKAIAVLNESISLASKIVHFTKNPLIL